MPTGFLPIQCAMPTGSQTLRFLLSSAGDAAAAAFAVNVQIQSLSLSSKLDVAVLEFVRA
jgi:hypothetical protein